MFRVRIENITKSVCFVNALYGRQENITLCRVGRDHLHACVMCKVPATNNLETDAAYTSVYFVCFSPSVMSTWMV